jgi:hypothetical protein
MSYIKTRDGAKIYLYRANTQNANLSATEYLPESQFGVGVNEVTPLISAASLTQNVPIYNGTINDTGANTLTGSSGGEDSTANTTTFKPGASSNDNTAQNLITNTSNTEKIWVISNLATAGTSVNRDHYCGLWLYFKNDSLDYLTTTTAVKIRLGSDSSNYYFKNYDKSFFVNGWNWLDLGKVSDLDITGSPTATLSYFYININTNNASDSWSEGDVIYDLLRSWTDSDLYKDYTATYPLIDLNNLEVTKQGYLTSLEAVGFNINGYGDYNQDSSRKLGSKVKMTTRSKADTDEFIFINKDRIIL